MSRIRVVVTAEDIAAGEPMNDTHCPMAQALRRRGFRPVVSNWSWLNADSNTRYGLSEPAIRFVGRFDSGLPVQPATFYLEGPAR